jgi:hypothetical protein
MLHRNPAVQSNCPGCLELKGVRVAADSRPESIGRSLGGFAEKRLEFAEDVSDGFAGKD